MVELVQGRFHGAKPFLGRVNVVFKLALEHQSLHPHNPGKVGAVHESGDPVAQLIRPLFRDLGLGLGGPEVSAFRLLRVGWLGEVHFEELLSPCVEHAVGHVSVVLFLDLSVSRG